MIRLDFINVSHIQYNIQSGSSVQYYNSSPELTREGAVSKVTQINEILSYQIESTFFEFNQQFHNEFLDYQLDRLFNYES